MDFLPNLLFYSTLLGCANEEDDTMGVAGSRTKFCSQGLKGRGLFRSDDSV